MADGVKELQREGGRGEGSRGGRREKGKIKEGMALTQTTANLEPGIGGISRDSGVGRRQRRAAGPG